MQDAFRNFKKHLRDVREGGEPELHERVDLRAWTALGVGGQADLLIRCRTADGVQTALDLFAAHGLPWLTLGAGSRLVPADRGLRIPVLNLSGNLGLWELDLDGVVAGGGANLAQVCRAAARTGLSGMEAFTATADSLGGAVQAAVRGHLALDEILDWVDIARPGTPVERTRTRERRQGEPGVKLNMSRAVVVRARLQLAGDGLSAIHSRIEKVGVNRLRRQPRSTAPFFADPPDDRAERLLVDAGCLGMTVRGARVSERFPNRVHAARTARADDVAELCRQVRQKIVDKTGISLTPALQFVDDEGRSLLL